MEGGIIWNAKHDDGFAFREKQVRVGTGRVGHVIHGAVPPQVQPVPPCLYMRRGLRCGKARQGKSQPAGFQFDRLLQVHGLNGFMGP